MLTLIAALALAAKLAAQHTRCKFIDLGTLGAGADLSIRV
jgi:hypothetical protein